MNFPFLEMQTCLKHLFLVRMSIHIYTLFNSLNRFYAFAFSFSFHLTPISLIFCSLLLAQTQTFNMLCMPENLFLIFTNATSRHTYKRLKIYKDKVAFKRRALCFISIPVRSTQIYSRVEMKRTNIHTKWRNSSTMKVNREPKRRKTPKHER